MNKSILKVGLIVDSLTVSKYVFDLVEWARHQSDIHISHLIVPQRPQIVQASKIAREFNYLRTNGIKRFLQRFFQNFARLFIWSAIIGIEKRKLLSAGYPEHFTNRSLDGLIDKQIAVECVVLKNGLVYLRGKDDINKIRADNLDILIHCGSEILPVDFLQATRFGVLSFLYGDNQANHRLPPGFCEVYNKEPQTNFMIQQLTEELDYGNILLKGSCPTRTYYLVNQENLYTRSNSYLKQLLKNIAASGKLPAIKEGYPYSGRSFRSLTLSIQFRHLSRILYNTIEYKFKYRLFNMKKEREKWSIAFQRRHWRELVMCRATKVINPAGRFLADPFVISRHGEDYCFVEDFDYSQRRGCISVLKLGKINSESIDKVIVEPFHMSFPYLFEYEGSLLMLPETSENKDIRIYECVDFPKKWVMKTVLMEGVSAADTMIFEKNGMWWLFTSIAPENTEDHCSELSIFYSTNPLSKDWTPHSMNPIYIDPSRARNGGVLYDGDQIYRVAQKLGFDRYGFGSTVFRIDRLDETCYAETMMVEIEPNFFDGILGTHHLHSYGNISVFDYLSAEKI